MIGGNRADQGAEIGNDHCHGGEDRKERGEVEAGDLQARVCEAAEDDHPDHQALEPAGVSGSKAGKDSLGLRALRRRRDPDDAGDQRLWMDRRVKRGEQDDDDRRHRSHYSGADGRHGPEQL